ncbi:MAG: CHAT domain-containing protein [Limnospira sp.]
MNTFKITIRPKLGESWPVVAEYTRSDNLTREHQGELKLSEPDFTRLISLQIQHREYGTFLGRALFRGDIETAYREAFVSSEAGLRVLLVVEDPDLRKLYWHWLCTPPNWDFIALAQRCPFSVYIPSRSDRIFQPATREELQALILVASPENSEEYGLARFDVEETVARLKTALGDIPTDVLAFTEGSVGEPTLPRLLNQLTQKSYTLLHVVCHGKVVKNGETALYWATEENQVRPIPGSDLLEQLDRQSVTGLPRLVFLSACESATPEAETALGGLAQRLGRELGIPAVLAMTQRVAIETAGLLSAAFYPRLREHGEVDRALVEATSILDRHDVLVPALFSRLGEQSLFVVERDRTPDLSNQIIYNYNYYYRQEATATATDGTKEADDLPCPYRGLFSFEPEDAEYFFGRDIFIEELYRAIQNRNFIPILGASGSGKSSVILAGLVPNLLKEGHWKFTHFRPGKEPFHALAKALIPLYTRNLDETDRIAQSRKLAGYFSEGMLPLSDVLQTIKNNHPQDRILLIADQFEELYTLCENIKTRRQFINVLLHTFRALAEASSLSIVLVAAMRADFLGNVLSYPPLADLLRDVDIKIRSMNSEELREVIEKPAEKLGVNFEHGLVERILKDIDKEPGNLPLLEFALTELWNKRQGKQLTHDAYREIGEVSGALTRYADEKFNQLKPEDKERVRRIFVQLVRPGAGTEDTRRVATKAELSESNWGLVKQLADARLVVTNRATVTRVNVGNLEEKSETTRELETVEVIHEALIRNWGQLQGWMETDREFRAWQERLRESKRQWEETGRDEGLLLRGAALFQAQEKLQERREELSEGEQLFIQLSRELYDNERHQKQRQRRQIIGGLVASFVTVSLVAGMAVLQWWKTYIAEYNSEMRVHINNLNYRFYLCNPRF